VKHSQQKLAYCLAVGLTIIIWVLLVFAEFFVGLEGEACRRSALWSTAMLETLVDKPWSQSSQK
jgi:hypothetical protein